MIAAPAVSPAAAEGYDLGLDVSDVADDPHPRDGGRAGVVGLDAGSYHVFAEPHLG